MRVKQIKNASLAPYGLSARFPTPPLRCCVAVSPDDNQPGRNAHRLSQRPASAALRGAIRFRGSRVAAHITSLRLYDRIRSIQ